MFVYKTKGTCSRRIELAVEDGVITACRFTDGCSGNLQGVSRLVIGKKVDDVIENLRGIQCQNGTSCPDQLARALEAYKAEKAQSA